MAGLSRENWSRHVTIVAADKERMNNATPVCRIGSLALVGICAAEIFRRIMLSALRGETHRFDEGVRRYVLSRRGRASNRVSDTIIVFTAPAICVTVTLAIAFSLRRRSVAAWLPTSLSPFIAMSVGALLSRTLEPRSAPSGGEGKSLS